MDEAMHPALHRSLATIGLFSLSALGAACAESNRSESTPDGGAYLDASAPPSVPLSSLSSHPSIALAQRLTARNADLAHLLDLNDGALAVAADGAFASAGFRKIDRPDPSLIGVRMPKLASDAWRAGAGRTEKWSMRLSAVGIAGVPGALVEGRLVYQDAWPATDVVVNTGMRGVEWLLLIHDASAPTSFDWKLTLGADLTVREGRRGDGTIELVDGAGDTAIELRPAVAIDARGEKRSAEMHVTEGTLRLSLDTSGLAYPIAIDPVASVPVWQLADSTYFSARGSQDGFMVRFGAAGPLEYATGYASSTAGITTASIWNGTSWSAAPSFPVAITNGTGTYAANGKAYEYGGCLDANCTTPTSSALYVGDPTTHAWSQVCASGSCGTGVGYDFVSPGLAAVGNQLIKFAGGYTSGGCPYGSGSVTNVLDLTSTATTFAALSPSLSPGARYGQVFVGGPNAPAALLFGGAGNGCQPDLSDTWLWTPNGAASGTWSCACNCTSATYAPHCANEPPPTIHAASAWDEARQRFVVYGGYARAGDGTVASQATYDFDPNAKTWTRLCSDGGVDQCGTGIGYYPSAAYDAKLRQVIVLEQGNTWRLYVRGGSCSAGSQCDTGNCVNGTCCTTSSCPTCQSCALAGSEGVCANLPALSADPVHGCTACDGAGACKSALGAACSAGSTCASGNCVNGTCCSTSSCGIGLTCADAAGTCLEVAGQACTSPGQCSSNACVDATCCTSASCPAGSHCNYGTPRAGGCLKDNGQTCTGAAQCGSGNCVDGVCCNTACGGQCQACDAAGAVGTCVTIAGSVHANASGAAPRTACAGSAPCGSLCDGLDASKCHYPGTAAACGTTSCASGIQKNLGTCDGSGGCTQTTTPCGAYLCGATKCNTSCTTGADCAANDFCKSGECRPVQDLGYSCGANEECKSAHCTDNVCCSVTSCGAGSACASLGPSAGQCLKANSTACSAASDCATGHCIDGVCCDKACDGQCEACDVTGSQGTCTPVNGPPHGTTRSACDALAATDCAKATCDGATRDKCGGFANGTTTLCGDDACTVDKKLQKHGLCDGRGSCAMPDPTSCVEYACDPTAKGCKSSCATNDDCSSSFRCDAGSGACVQGASCSADRTQSIDKGGIAKSCAPFLCGTDGACMNRCASSDDCVPGTSCDSVTSACIGIAANGSTGSGGCDASGVGSGSAWGGAGALLGLAALLRRRRAA
jgi:hypothetical protein